MSVFVSVSFFMFLWCQINEYTRLFGTQEYDFLRNRRYNKNRLTSLAYFTVQTKVFCLFFNFAIIGINEWPRTSSTTPALIKLHPVSFLSMIDLLCFSVWLTILFLDSCLLQIKHKYFISSWTWDTWSTKLLFWLKLTSHIEHVN